MKITTPTNVPMLLQNDDNQKETWRTLLNNNINFKNDLGAKIQFELSYFTKYFKIYFKLIDWSNMDKKTDKEKSIELNSNQSKTNDYIFCLSSIVSIYRLILLLNLMISVIPFSANAATVANDAFSIDKLMEYTELVSKKYIFLLIFVINHLYVLCFM